MAEKRGKVYLVGAGPGDIAYLTVRGQQILAQAEVIIYDALIDPQLLELAPANCLCLDMGKRGNRPNVDQEEINHLLVQHCQQGKQVVRLKNGDPFIFGRGTTEVAALGTAGCDFEVVPGVSSALGVPLLAGIPLTEARLSRCFAVVSAHDPAALNWQALARIDTLVILMGGKRLAEIVCQLQSQGRSSQTPTAVIRWGGRSDQQVWRGTLGGILKQMAEESLAPAVIVIGEVARLQFHSATDDQVVTSYEEPHPLTGKTILVTRAAGQSSQFSDRLQQMGAQVIEMPALEIGPPSSWEDLDGAITHLAEFDWLILTSTNGVDYFFERLWSQGKDIRTLAGIQIAVVGQKTAASLHQRGLRPDFVPPEFVADLLVTHFPSSNDLSGIRILFPRVETGGRETLVAELTARGAEVVEVPAYQSRCPATIDPFGLDTLRSQSVDVITFASSKTAKNFCQLLDQAAQKSASDSIEGATDHQWQAWLEGVCIASIGPQTSKTCRALLGRVDVEAMEYTLEGLTRAILNHYKQSPPS